MSQYFTSKEVRALTAKGTLMSREEAFAEIDAFYGDPNALGRSAAGDSAEEGMDIDEGSYSRQLSVDGVDGVKVDSVAVLGEVTCNDVCTKVTASQPFFETVPSATAPTKARKPAELENPRRVNTNGGLIEFNSLDAITVDTARHPSTDRRDSVLSLPPVHARSKDNNTPISIPPLSLDSVTAGSTNPPSTILGEVTRGARYQTPPRAVDTDAFTDEIYHSARSQATVHPPVPHPDRPTKDSPNTLPQTRKIIQSDLSATPKIKTPTMTDPPSSDKNSLYDEMQSEDNLRCQQGISGEEIRTPTLFSKSSDAGHSRRTSKARITDFEDIPVEARRTPPFDHVQAAHEKADAMTKRAVGEAPQKGKETNKGNDTEIRSPLTTKERIEDGPSKAMPRKSARQLNIEQYTDDLADNPIKTTTTTTKKRKDTPVDGEDIQQPKKKKMQPKAKQDLKEKEIAVKDEAAHDDRELPSDPSDKSRAVPARPAGSHPLGKRELIMLGVPHGTEEGGRKTRAQAEREVEEEAPKRGKPRKTQLAGKCA